GDRSFSLARQPDAGPLSEAEGTERRDELFLADRLADLGGADVRGLRQHRHRSRPLHLVRVVDAMAVVRPDTVLAVEGLVQGDGAAVERGGENEALDGRSGLELILDGAVAPAHRISSGFV